MGDLFRTPDERFEGLPQYGYAPHWHDAGGLRLQEDRGELIAELTVEFLRC